MKKFTIRNSVTIVLLLLMIAGFTKVSAQTATISPGGANIGAGQSQFFTITTSGFGSDNNDRTFEYTITGPGATNPATPVSFNCTSGCNSETHGFQFSTPGSYNVSVTVTQTQGGSAVASASTTLTVWLPNLYSTSGTGPIRNWNIDPVTGAANHANDLFTPSVSTAAIAKNSITANDALGALYYLENSNYSNNGTVNLYAALPTGGGETLIATADLNGSSNAGLGFVRLGFDPTGTGWILAGDGSSTLFLAKFTGNGVAPTTILTQGNVTVAPPGSINDFQNGDLAITGAGTLYAVANVSNGDTYVYTMNNLSGPVYILSRKWKLVQPGGSNFTGSVNGVAFTINGSLHISTSEGLYFIDQATANIVSGTVECDLVFSQSGLTDLASDKFPAQTTLPVKLSAFNAYLNQNSVVLNWKAENEQNFSHYEVERKSPDNLHYTKVGQVNSLNQTGKSSYSLTDNITGEPDHAFYYRLKMVDLDGQFSYSHIVLVKREDNNLSAIKISPNPVMTGSGATIRFIAETNSVAVIRIIDMNGRVISEQQNKVFNGMNSIMIHNTGNLKTGTYIILVRNGNQTESVKFTVSQ